MKTDHFSMTRFILMSLPAIFLMLSGCTSLTNTDGDEMMSAVSFDQPYYPADFKEIQIPGALKLNRDKSMFINTQSFKGGFLQFKGRLEVNSLTDFFINTMPKMGWQRTGIVKYKNVLLAFSKPGKTCMITITETDLKFFTEVYIYVAENLNPHVPFSPAADQDHSL